MSGDYLWDKTGPRDPEVVRIERALGSLRPDELPPLTLPEAPLRRPGWISAGIGVTGLVSIAASLALVALVWSNRATFPSGPAGPSSLPGSPGPSANPPGGSSFDVTRLEGQPRIESKTIADHGALGVGRRLETDANARASIDIGGIGRVDVEPGTRLSLVNTKPGDYRLRLDAGTLHAVIWAPPGQFFIETPSSTAVDLGCAYTLSVNNDGSGLVRVTTGWVGFEWQGRESFIPAGAVCTTRRGLGPGTPHYDDVSDAVRSAIATIDEGADAPGAVASALDVVLAQARARDVVTLWHLLGRLPRSGTDRDVPRGNGDGSLSESQRDRVFDRLAAFVPPPPGVTREGIRAGRRDMLDLWWDSLGLGTASWWRTWKQPWK